MKKTMMVLGAALLASSTLVSVANSAELTVMSWGGAYGEAQNAAHVKPWAAKTGNAAKMVDSDDPAGPIKA